MDGRLLSAAITGDARSMIQLASHNPSVLHGTTPQGNTCLHISCIHGHEGFCMDVMELDQSMALVSAVNEDGETPLVTAITRGHAPLASVLLSCCCGQQLSETILRQDKRGCNALHHAIRRGYGILALELIEAEPALSNALNKYDESPMFIAALRNFTVVFDKLLDIPNSCHSGPFGLNVLHAAVRNGNSVMVKRVIETRPLLARQENKNKQTPMHLAASEDMVEVLTVLLEHDQSLGYLISTAGAPLLCIAAIKGHVGVAQELLKHCPDAPYSDAEGSTCLHVAVLHDHAEFVAFVLESKELQHVINMADNCGVAALHLANNVDSKQEIVAALLQHQDIDPTMLNNAGGHAMSLSPMEEDTGSTTPSGNASSSSSQGATSSSGAIALDRHLLEAAKNGDTVSMEHLASLDRDMLLGATPQGNTCLHIAAMHGHEGFCKAVVALNWCLVSAVNGNNDTPLLIAVKRGHVNLSSFLLMHCHDRNLSEAILKKDNDGCNVLHHALRSGHREVTLELLATVPALSQDVDHNNESPMFIAVTRNDVDIFEKLLEIPDSADSGAFGYNALHAAVRNGNSGITKRLMETRPGLVREETVIDQYTPMHLAAVEDKIDVLKVLLEHDPSLGYLISTTGIPILCTAAWKGHVGVARELLRHCPDAPYRNTINGSTCLHEAIEFEQTEFVEFVLNSQLLRHLTSMQNRNGDTAQHLANQTGMPRRLIAALQHPEGFSVKLGIASTRTSAIMDSCLLEAATTGDARMMQQLATHDQGMLSGTTPQGNTCVHIASIHGHEGFCRAALALNPLLLAAVNSDGETPLHSAVISGRVSVTTALLRCYDQQRSEAILKQDNRGCNALHHAIRSGHRDLALELLQAEPALSRAVNQYKESPMFMAVMRNYADVFEKLLSIPDSAHGGAFGCNALHAAVRNGNSAIATKIMETRPELATEEEDKLNTPMHLAVLWDKVGVLTVLLQHDRSLGCSVLP
ncbi:unnamed protein product [Urochloa humidicola]